MPAPALPQSAAVAELQPLKGTKTHLPQCSCEPAASTRFEAYANLKCCSTCGRSGLTCCWPVESEAFMSNLYGLAVGERSVDGGGGRKKTTQNSRPTCT